MYMGKSMSILSDNCKSPFETSEPKDLIVLTTKQEWPEATKGCQIGKFLFQIKTFPSFIIHLA